MEIEINQEGLSSLSIADLAGLHDFIMHRYDGEPDETRLDKLRCLETELKARENNLFII